MENPAVEVIELQIRLASPESPFGEFLERILTLRAKIIDFKEHQPTREVNQIKLDYENITMDSSVYLLLLGKGGRDVNAIIPDLALVVREMNDGKFERIGSVYDARCNWNAVENQILVLI